MSFMQGQVWEFVYEPFFRGLGIVILIAAPTVLGSIFSAKIGNKVIRTVKKHIYHKSISLGASHREANRKANKAGKIVDLALTFNDIESSLNKRDK